MSTGFTAFFGGPKVASQVRETGLLDFAAQEGKGTHADEVFAQIVTASEHVVGYSINMTRVRDPYFALDAEGISSPCNIEKRAKVDAMLEGSEKDAAKAASWWKTGPPDSAGAHPDCAHATELWKIRVKLYGTLAKPVVAAFQNPDGYGGKIVIRNDHGNEPVWWGNIKYMGKIGRQVEGSFHGNVHGPWTWPASIAVNKKYMLVT